MLHGAQLYCVLDLDSELSPSISAADRQYVDSFWGVTPLHIAVEEKDEFMTSLLLDTHVTGNTKREKISLCCG